MTEHASEHSHWLRYLAVWIVLLALTGLSFLAAQFDIGTVGIMLGLLIATVKATVVALYFMHLIEGDFLYSLVGLATIIWVALLCAGIAADVGMR